MLQRYDVNDYDGYIIDSGIRVVESDTGMWVKYDDFHKFLKEAIKGLIDIGVI